jgi:hypothetical protein
MCGPGLFQSDPLFGSGSSLGDLIRLVLGAAGPHKPPIPTDPSHDRRLLGRGAQLPYPQHVVRQRMPQRHRSDLLHAPDHELQQASTSRQRVDAFRRRCPLLVDQLRLIGPHSPPPFRYRLAISTVTDFS